MPARPLATSSDAVWITDAVLAGALARLQLCALSHPPSRPWPLPRSPSSPPTTRRFASHVPGPLESRRRLGKRQMTALHQMHPTLPSLGLPVWATLPNTVDLAQWQWIRPRDDAERAAREALREAAVRARQEARDAWAVVLPAWSVPRWLQEGDRGETKPLAQTDTSFPATCTAFQTQLARGELSPEDAAVALDRLWRSRPSDADPAALLTATLEGVRQREASHDLGSLFWRRLLLCAAEQCLADPTTMARLAADCLLTVPPDEVGQLDDRALPPLLATAMTACAADDDAFSVRLAAALRDVDPGAIVAATTQQIASAEATRRAAAALCWLHVLAHMPQVRQDGLFAALETLRQATTVTLSSTAVCRLLLAHWTSRGYTTTPVTHLFRIERGDEDGLALATLVSIIHRSRHSRPRAVALYQSLVCCLRLLDRDAATELVRSVTAVARSTTGPAPLSTACLEAVAWATDDVYVALQLHRLHRQRWSVGFWDKFADRLAALLDRRAITPDQAAFALNVSSGTRGRKGGPSQPASATNAPPPLGPATIGLVQRLTADFALAPDLTPRQALRRVEQCRDFLRRHRVPYSAPSAATVQRALFHLVTRDLDRCRPGRLTRLRWLLVMIERSHGPVTATSSARALARWRKAAIKQMEWLEQQERQTMLQYLATHRQAVVT